MNNTLPKRALFKNTIKQSPGDRLFNVFVIICVSVLAFLCLFPFINIVAISFSSRGAVMANRVAFWPIEFNILAYQAVFNNNLMVQALWFTIVLTLVYTAFSLLMTVLCAYPLSRRDLKGRSVLLVYIVFTMYFNGGMIPEYLNIKELGLINNFWSLVLPGLITTYNMILMKTFFQNLPVELEESARVDGASDTRIMLSIMLPLSKATLATIALFYAVARWNNFSDSLLYINDAKMYTLQLRLRQIISENQCDEIIHDSVEIQNLLVPETIKAACLIFSMVPILLVYPWLQKYFVKGVVIGSIKG